MKVKMILPALTEAKSPHYRPIKYSLFPPLGLASLAGYLRGSDDVVIQDEHVEQLDLSDEPDLVVIQVYITSAARSYELADHYRRKGAYVCLGGLHVTSLPEEAAPHADSIFLGPGEDIWPQFLKDFRAGCALPVYKSQARTLIGVPPIRRDLIKRHLYLVPNSIVVSRRCPINVISAISARSSKRASTSTRRLSSRLWMRLKDYPASTSTFWMITCWAIRNSLPRSSMA
jgi:radical SAM superfamily enzyme YgiQ (UPF0313 family)